MNFGKGFTKGFVVVLGAVATVGMMATAFMEVHLGPKGFEWTPRFHFSAFVADFPKHLPWLLAFSFLTLVMIPARAFAWQRTLKRPVPFRERYHLVAIGAFVHNALPGKFGDIFRAFLLGRTRQIPFVESLGSVAVCKLLEFAALMALVGLSFLGPFSASMEKFGPASKIAAWVCLGLVLAVVLMARFSGGMAAWLQRKRAWPKLQPHLLNVSAGLSSAKSARDLMLAFALSFPPVVLNASAYGLGLQGVGISQGLFAGAVVLGAIALGQAAPGLPAGTGIYYFVTSWAARSLGASPENAAAFATLTHLGTILTQISVGAFSVWVRKIRWKDLKGALRKQALEGKAPTSA